MVLISSLIIPYYSYYEHPEGVAPFQKLYGAAKYGFAGGLCASTIDCCIYARPKTWPGIFNNVGYWTVPLTAMGAGFASVTYILTRLRGKDDKLNYFLGTVTSIGIMQYWLKNMERSMPYGVLLMIAAMIKKDSMEKGYDLFPTQTERREPARFTDLTITKDPRTIKGWNPNTRNSFL